VSSSVASKIRDHYIARWGPPRREGTFTANDPEGPLTVSVGKWLPEQTTQGVTIYASWRSRQGLAPVEFYVGFRPENDDVADSFALLSRFASRSMVNDGDTVEVEGGLWPGTRMNAWLVASPPQPVIANLDLHGIHVHFLQAIPLYPAERTWKAVHGRDALMQRWEQALVEFWDPNRRPWDA
jgi:hypothetical protein